MAFMIAHYCKVNQVLATQINKKSIYPQIFKT